MEAAGERIAYDIAFPIDEILGSLFFLTGLQEGYRRIPRSEITDSPRLKSAVTSLAPYMGLSHTPTLRRF